MSSANPIINESTITSVRKKKLVLEKKSVPKINIDKITKHRNTTKKVMPPKMGFDWLLNLIADTLAFFTKNLIGRFIKKLFIIMPIAIDKTKTNTKTNSLFIVKSQNIF